MGKTSLLLTNYPEISQTATFEKVGGKDTLEIVTGYDISGKIDCKRVTNQIANDLILGILGYDEVVVEASHMWDIIQVWGSTYVKELLRQKILRVVNDATLNPVMIRNNQDNWHVDFFPYTQSLYDCQSNMTLEFNHDIWNNIAVKFHRNNFKGIEAESLLVLVDEGAIRIDENEIHTIATEETNNDLKNSQYFDQFKIENGRMYGRSSFEKQIRLQELNKTFAIASILKSDSVRCDAEIRTLLSRKTNVLTKQYTDGVSSLNQVIYEKKLPEFGGLFINGIISLDDILKLRDNYNGKLFRYWMNNNEYEEAHMRTDIMNSTSNVLGKSVSQIIRLVSCNLLGCFGFIPGLAASAFDSYILNKMASGWHPNFFLDDRVKSTIDVSIKRHENDKKRVKYSKLFQGVNRNDKCPCGSGLKFKKCHGKLI